MSTRPIGRPTDYRPEYCQKVIEIGEQGKSVYHMADACGVCHKTLYLWADANPEFLQAFTRAKQKSKMWLLDSVVVNLENKFYQAKSVEFLAKFIHDFREKDYFVSLPELKDGKTFAEKAKAVVEAVANGKITPVEGEKIANIISMGAKVEEVTELKAELQKIKDLQNG